MTRKDVAINKFKAECNCCQAVVCAYCDLIGIDEKFAFEMAAKYGGGRYDGICGAVLGMYIVANYDKGLGEDENPVIPHENSKSTLEIMEKAFLAKNSSVMCSELRVDDVLEKLRLCSGYVEDAAQIIEDVIGYR